MTPTLHRARAEGRIVGRLVEMQLEFDYRNDEAVEIEVVHTFPLPWQAVLLGLEVTLGNTTRVGLIKAREAARDAYEEAMDDGDRPLLVTVNPDQSYTLELGLLRPGERCSVRLRYAQLLRTEQGSLRWMLPTTLAPRYGDALREGGFEPHAVPQIDPVIEYPFELRLRLEGELAQARIHSPSHAVSLHRDASASVRLELKGQAWLDRDFVLLLDDLPKTNHALLVEDPFEPGRHVVMATLTPAGPVTAPRPVRMKVLVDCSGSMAGDSLQAARAALQQILYRLEAKEAFSLSRFGSTVEHQSRALWPVNARTRALGLRWVEALEADLGGTEMGSALRSTLDIGHDAGPVDVLLITDGLIHAIDDILHTAQRLQQRLFIVGMGASGAEGLLRRLAEQSGGSCEFVAPQEDATAAIVRLFQRMRAPRIEAARLQWPAGCSVHAVNGLPPTLFAGDEISVFAHLGADETHVMNEVQLWGRVEGTADDVCLATARLDVLEDQAGMLARLAAHRRYLEGRAATTQGELASHGNLHTLAERYQLVTSDTALFLVQRLEGEARAQALPELRRIPQMLAAGWGGYGSVHPGSANLDLSRIGPPTFLRRIPEAEPSPPLTRRVQAAIKGLADRIPHTLRRLRKGRMPNDRVHRPECNPLFWASLESPGLQPEHVLTPAGVVEWLRLNPKRLPTDYVSLHRMGLPDMVIDGLRLTVSRGHPEKEVILAFLRVMAAHHYTEAQQADPTLRHLAQSLTAPEDLLETLYEALRSMTATSWPSALLDVANPSHPKPM